MNKKCKNCKKLSIDSFGKKSCLSSVSVLIQFGEDSEYVYIPKCIYDETLTNCFIPKEDKDKIK